MISFNQALQYASSNTMTSSFPLTKSQFQQLDKLNSFAVHQASNNDEVRIMPAKMIPFYNRIDIGILLCFLDICLTHSKINYYRTLYSDCDDDAEMILNAVYKLK